MQLQNILFSITISVKYRFVVHVILMCTIENKENWLDIEFDIMVKKHLTSDTPKYY